MPFFRRWTSAALVFVTSSACGQSPASVPRRFEWLPSVSAPDGYPMQVVRGVFVLADGREVDVPAGAIVDNGWGTVGSVEIVGKPGPKAWPTQLTVTWFSYTEDRFYTLSAALPIEATRAALETGYRHPRTGAAGRFDTVLLGLAPGGTAQLWLAGNGIVRRLGRFTGAPSADLWPAILNDPRTPRATYVREVLAERPPAQHTAPIAADGLSGAWWVSADERVPIHLSVVGVPMVRLGWYHAANGEHEYLDAEQMRAATASLRAAPVTLEVAWFAPDGARRRAVIRLNETEARAALETLRSEAGATGVRLVVDLALTSATGSTPLVSLHRASRRVDLRQVTARITAG